MVTRNPTQGGRNGGRGGRGRGRGRNNNTNLNYFNNNNSFQNNFQHGHGNSRNNNSGNNRPICQVCGKPGHDALNCYHRFDHGYRSESRRQAAAAITTPPITLDNNWYLDSGATDHLTNDLDRLTINDRYRGHDQVHTANGTGMDIIHVSQSSIESNSRLLRLKNVLHVPQLNKNLLSVHKITNNNQVSLEFYPNSFLMKDLTTRETLLQGQFENGLYPIKTPAKNQESSRTYVSLLNVKDKLLNVKDKPLNCLSSSRISHDIWHRRLGHPSNVISSSLLKSNKSYELNTLV